MKSSPSESCSDKRRWWLEKLVRNEPELKFLVIQVVNLLIAILDRVLDLALGWSLRKGSKLERQLALREGRSAQLHVHLAASTLMGSREFSRYQLSSLLLLHHQYVHPEFILSHDNVYLWDIDKEQVFFSVTSPQVDLYDVTEHPWAWMHMSHEAQHVLVMSLDDFHKVAERVGDPEVRMTGMLATARCGSTLISHMMHKLPRTRSVAEPWVLWNLQSDAKEMKRDEQEVKHIVQSIFRILCRSSNDVSKTFDHIFFKLTPLEAPLIHVVKELFPKMKLGFNSRMPVDTLKSWGRLVRKIQVQSIFQSTLETIAGRYLLKKFLHLPIPMHREDLQERCRLIVEEQLGLGNGNFEELLSLLYIFTVHNFLEYRDLYSFVLLYEDLMEDPASELTNFFRTIDEPLEHVCLAMEALKVDSQKGMGGGVGANDGFTVPQSVWIKIDSYIHILKCPISLSVDREEFRRIVALDRKQMHS